MFAIDAEEELRRFNFIVKRVRFVGGSGKVFIYKYGDTPEGKQPIAVTLREYDTHNYTDLRLYDTMSLLLDDSKSSDEFELLLEGVLLGEAGGVLNVYDLTDVLTNLKVIKE